MFYCESEGARRPYFRGGLLPKYLAIMRRMHRQVLIIRASDFLQSFAIWWLIIGLTMNAIAGVRGASAQNADPITRHSRALVFGDTDAITKALGFFRLREKPDIAATMIFALRYRPAFAKGINAALQALTGHKATSWNEWMEWQQDHPEIKPHAGYLDIKREGLGQLDARYKVFFRIGWDQPEDMRIRLEEIVWGGPPAMTGIPSLDNPKMIPAGAADYMLEDDLVFGIEINGDVRAYPLRIMGWHEMFNDVIGGVPVALAYCTLCGSGILYETKVPGRPKPFVFGSSGMLYRSNKLMFDWETYSLWNQFIGEPVVGPLAKSTIRLKTRPVSITSWKAWRAAHPDTRILSLQTGYQRDYSSGAVYKEYFASPNLMFPVSVRDSKTFKIKDYVFGIRDVAGATKSASGVSCSSAMPRPAQSAPMNENRKNSKSGLSAPCNPKPAGYGKSPKPILSVQLVRSCGESTVFCLTGLPGISTWASGANIMTLNNRHE